jgi:hypothetical protein
MSVIAEIAPHQPVVHLVENSLPIHDAAALPTAPYMDIPTLSPEKRRRDILNMVLRDDRHSNVEPEWPHAEAGLHLLMLNSEWPYTAEGKELQQTGRERQWIPVFAEWMAKNYPDPGEVAYAMRDWREMGHGDSPGAKELAEDVEDAGSTGLTLAFSLIWGDRWKAARTDRQFNFYDNPTDEKGLVGVEPETQKGRQVAIHRLESHEKYDVGSERQPVLTADEVEAQFGIRADLRGVVFMGNERSAGVAFGVFDLGNAPRNKLGRKAPVFAKYPTWRAPADAGRLMLVPAIVDPPETLSDGTILQRTPLSVSRFEGNPVVFSGEKGEVALGRPTGDNDGSLLQQLYRRVPSTVSRVHARITWNGLSWSLINEAPHNQTLVQSADVGTEKVERLIALQQRVGNIAATTSSS